MRSWWNLAEKKVANVVEKFTCNYATPTLWAAEVKSVQDSKATFDNMVVSFFVCFVCFLFYFHLILNW